MRMQTPDTGALPPTEAYGWKLGEAMRDLLKRTGPAVVGTHSYAGQIGWYGAMKSPDLVKAVVAYEPGQVVYPEGGNSSCSAETQPRQGFKTRISEAHKNADFYNLWR